MSYRLLETHEMDSVEMRAVYAKCLLDMMDAGDPIIPMDADLMRAIGLLPYRDKYPKNIFDCGIAEQNMLGVAAGLSAEGFIPFPHTFGVFASRRAFDQFFLSGAYAGLNVKLVGSDPGVMAELNGGTHEAFEDVGLMRTVPGVTIVEPTDAVMVKSLIPAVAKTYGMFYIRLTRLTVPKIYAEGSEFELGKAALLREGGDLTIFAAGVEVPEALQAAEILAGRGIQARVYDMFTIKPIDREAVVRAARETGAIVTAENHNVVGGLGSAVAEVLAENCPAPMARVGVEESFGEVGFRDYLKSRFHLTSGDIVEKAMSVLSRKS